MHARDYDLAIGEAYVILVLSLSLSFSVFFKGNSGRANDPAFKTRFFLERSIGFGCHFFGERIVLF